MNQPKHGSESIAERLMNEGFVGVSSLAREAGRFRQGSATNPATITRWILKGVRCPGGGTVKLEAVRVGGKWLSSRKAFVRFVERQNLTEPVPSSTLVPRNRIQQSRAARRAAAELESLGV